MMTFDEYSVTRFISSRLKEAGRPDYGHDELLNVVDMIWDFYETRGLLDPDVEDEPERAELEPEIVSYAATLLKRDKKAKVDPDDLPLIVAAELDYEDTLLDGDEGLEELSDLLDKD